MQTEMSPTDWIDGLTRIRTRPDLPITLQGGEPTIFDGFYKIVMNLYERNKSMDLLTNGTFDVRAFCEHINPSAFQREAKYASIRFSYHSPRSSAHGLIHKVWTLQNLGYQVGIWVLDHPDTSIQMDNEEIIKDCSYMNIDCRTKEFLGNHNDIMYGNYKYLKSCNMSVYDRKEVGVVECKPSELLIGPTGHIFRCHTDLYAGKGPLGHILDKEIKFPDFLPCGNYGGCNPCDVKVKNNRFQVHGHTAVTIRGKEVREYKRRCPNEY